MSSLLDTVKTKQKTRQGIIDYSTKKQIIFYDFTHNNDPSLRLLLTLWKTEEDIPYNRFSLYAMMEFPSINLPEPMVIPINAILNDIETPDVVTGCSVKRVSLSSSD